MSKDVSEIEDVFNKVREMVQEYQQEVGGAVTIPERLNALAEEQWSMTSDQYYLEISNVLRDVNEQTLSTVDYETLRDALQNLNLPSVESYREDRLMMDDPVEDVSLMKLAKEGDSAVIIDIVENMSHDVESANAGARFCSKLADEYVDAVNENVTENEDSGFSLVD